VKRETSIPERILHLGAALALLLFLAISAPHRVHHFFEQFSVTAESQAAHVEAHEHADDLAHEHEHTPARGAQQNDCVVLSVAQHSHAAAVQPFEVQLVERFITRRGESTPATTVKFDAAPCSQRAPPLA